MDLYLNIYIGFLGLCRTMCRSCVALCMVFCIGASGYVGFSLVVWDYVHHQERCTYLHRAVMDNVGILRIFLCYLGPYVRQL